jgi:S1-C subfamily serine protease
LPRTLVRELDLLADQAVGVVDVATGSPAERAGLAAGDLIVALNGRIIAGVDDLHRLLTVLPADAALELTVIRNDARIDVTLGH